MNIADVRRRLPELADLDDEQVIDALQQAYYPDLSREDIASTLGVKVAPPPPPPAPERTVLGTLGDTAISAVQGATDMVSIPVGLADMATGGRVGKALQEGVDIPGTDGFRLRFAPGEAAKALDEGLSDAQKHANKQVMEAEGLWETIKAAVRNPSVAGQSAVRSLPSMLAGGLVGRGLGMLGARPALAAGAGEGVAAAGANTEQIRQETPDGLLTGEQALLGAATGATTTAFGALGAKIAQRLGIADVDTMIVGAAMNQKAAKGIVRQVLEGAVSEGLLEELPQSISEQVLQNMALGRPLDEGVSQSAVLGAMAGGLMGGGANILHGMSAKPQQEQPPAPTPGDVLNAPSVDAAIDTAMRAVAPSLTGVDPAALMGQPGGLDPARELLDAAAARQTLPGATPANAGMIGAPIGGGLEQDQSALLANGRQVFEDRRADEAVDTAVFDARRRAEEDLQRTRQFDQPKLPRREPASGGILPALDEVVQAGDILTPKTGAPFTKAAANLRLKALRQDGKDAELVEVAEGGFIVRPVKKGSPNAKDVDLAGRAGGLPAAGAAGSPAAAAGAAAQPAQAGPRDLAARPGADTADPAGRAGGLSGPGGRAGGVDARAEDAQAAAPAAAVPGAAGAQPAAAGGVGTTAGVLTGKSALFDGYGASRGSVSEGTRRQLMVDPAGGYFWGDWRQEAQRDVGAVAGGADAAHKPASFASAKEAREAAEATPTDKTAAAAPSVPRVGQEERKDAGRDGAAGQAGADAAADAKAALNSGERAAERWAALSPRARAATVARAGRVVLPNAEWSDIGPADRLALARAMQQDSSAVSHETNPANQDEEQRASDRQQTEDGARAAPAEAARDETSPPARGDGAAAAGAASPAAGSGGVEAPGVDAWEAAGREWTRTRDVDRRAMLSKERLPERWAGMAWAKMSAEQREKIGRAMGFQPTYAQRKVKNAQAIIDWARSQGFKDIEAADKLHVTIAFSRAAMQPLAVGNQSPAYQKGVISGRAGREVTRLGDEGAIVLKFASPVLETRWKQFRQAGASWDFEGYQPHVTISYGDKGMDLSKVQPYLGPIELGEELTEPLDAGEAKASESPTGLPMSDPRRAALEAAERFEKEGDEDGARVARARAEDNAQRFAPPADEQPRDPESGQFVAPPNTVEEAVPLVDAYFKWFLGENPNAREPMNGIHDGHTFEFDSPPFTKDGEVIVDHMKGTVHRYGLAWKQAKAAAAPKATPQVPNDPGTKYVLPSFATGGRRAAPAPIATRAPAAEKTPTVSANTVFTDEMAEKARARLKAKLGRLGSGIDPEMMLDGITLAGYHLERGARTFAAFARAMVDDLGAGVKPFLKSWYSALRYDPRAQPFAAGMSSAAMVDEFDLNDVSAPSDSNVAQPGDTGESDDAATRDMDSAGTGAPEGAPAAGVRAPAGGRDAGAAPAGGRRGDQPRDADADAPGGGLAGGVGDGARAAPVPAGRGGQGRGDAGQRRVPRAPRPDEGPGLFDDAGREGPAGVNPAPNAPPIAAPQPTAEEVADFTIEDDLALGEGGQKTKFRANVAAIRLAKDLLENPRTATRDEQRTLAKYVGWGGLPQAFDADNQDWSREHAELKELLTPEEFDAARRSTRYAHYTSREIVQDGIYAALRRFGFTGGRVLEGGAGVGNFIGLMPADMRSAGRVTAIEREPIAAAIAKALYPLQNVQLADFTEFRGQDGFFDAAVGNPPFASDTQVDKSGRKHLNGLSLHNYFFAKEVDMLREGGILAQVVSNYFLDAANDRARQYIADRTRFLGAIRLPNNAFAKNANTEVTTDLIFLQKLPEAEWGTKKTKEAAKAWLEVQKYTDPRKPGAKLQLNQYFIDHPEMMLGDFGAHGTMYGPDQPALIARPGQDTAALLREAVGKLPENIYTSIAAQGTKDAVDAAIQALKNPPPVQEGGYFIEGDKLLQRLPDIAGEARGKEITPETMWTAKTKLGEDGFDRIKRLSGLRETLRSLLAAELSNNAAEMKTLRERLNEQYDAYAKKHGLLNDRGTARVFDDDPDFPLLLSLEHNYVPPIGPSEAKKLGIKPTKSRADKGPIFRQRVVETRQQVRKVETPEDALAVSMAERGRLDTAYIGELLGKSAEDVLREMTQGDRPLLFLDPASNEYVLRDAYLSGNVRAKLAQAKAASLHGNVRALEQVQPEDVGAHQISAKIGAPWVPVEVYEAFGRELLGEESKVRISYMKLNSSYSVYATGANEVNETNKWGTADYKASELLSALLNNRTIRVMNPKDSEGRTTVNQEATENANTKAQEIKDRFSDWLFSDPERSELLVRAYNDTNNNYVTRTYDGSWMTFPGKVPDSVIKFRRHQRNAIARIVQDRTALLDHVVGAGKTFTIVSAAMELRRTGLAKRPMVAVPNHLVKQWAADFYRLYPGANILTATKKDFDKLARRRFLAKAATGDWDAIIIAHSSFGFIQPGADFEAEFNQRQIALIMEAIQDVEDSDAEKTQKKRTVKQLEAMQERLEKRIERLRNKPMDALLDFEELGVDQLFVDEAHLFKNLMFTTKLQNVAGLGDSQGSQRAYDMYVKTQQVMEQNGRGQGVVFATGTPVSNSLAEKYHMMRYLMPRQMEELGFQSFDAWANTFAEVNQVWMQKPSGDGFKAQNRMSTFVNVHELLKLFDQVADTVTLADIKRAYKEENGGKDFPIPPVKTGRRQPVSLEKSAAQEAYMQDIARRAEAIEKRRGPPKKGEDNILVLMTDARKAAMDIRLVDPDIIEREPGGRIDRAAAEVMDRYTKFADVKGTQLVFSDLGTPIKHAKAEMKEYEALKERIDAATDDVRASASLGSEDAQAIVDDAEDAEAELDAKGPDWLTAVKAALRGFSVYDDLKAALIERGIPEHEIAFIHDYNTDEQKAGLFRKVNAGTIRVLIGSTQKMGAGTNVQERLVAEHHLDVPWRPSDVEQREGRIERQGNLLLDQIPNFEVEILAYVTKDTLDMRMWQIQEVKLKLINQLRTRQIERDIDNAFEDMEMSAGEMQAAATGNMDLLHEIQARNDIKKLEQKRRSFEAQKNDLISRRKSVAQKLQRLPKEIEQAEREEKLAKQYQDELAAEAGKFKVTIDGKEYTDADSASKYLLTQTEKKMRTRTVERDGKKVREEISEEEYNRLAAYGDELRAGGKTNEDPEVQANIDKMIGFNEAKAAPLDVTMNGETYTARAKLAEAFSNLRGDRDPILWKFDGKRHVRRSTAALAVQQNVADAIADETVKSVGTVGPFEVSVEGQPRGKMGASVEVTMRAGDVQMDGTLSVPEAATALGVAEAVIEWAHRHAERAGSYKQYRIWDLQAAQKQKAELDKTEDLGEWPDQGKLEAARERHKEILQRLSKAGAKTQDDGEPAFRQDEPGEVAQRRAVGELQQEMDAITEEWDRAPAVTVVSSIASPSVPRPIREEALRRMRKGGGTPSGTIYDGQVWLFADRLGGQGKAATVLYHEVLGHFGMRGHFGKEFDQHLQRVVDLRGPDVERMMRERMGVADTPENRLRAAEEVLAYMAQTRPDLGLVQRAIALIRTFLRKLPGLGKLQLSDEELIRDFILPARRFVEGDGPRGGGRPADGETAFSADSKPFYSALSREVAALTPKSLPVAGWQGAINNLVNKGAVKADEVEWSGLREWLALQQGKVDKAAILDFLQANGVRVEEVVKGGAAGVTKTRRFDELNVRLTALGYDLNQDDLSDFGVVRLMRRSDSIPFEYDSSHGDAGALMNMDTGKPMRNAASAELLEIADELQEMSLDEEGEASGAEPAGTRYSRYTLPGGENYREVLLTLPVPMLDRKRELMEQQHVAAKRGDAQEVARLDALIDRASAAAAGEGRYNSSHWSEPNIIAHIRVNERTDADGKRVLFVEELQSDWAQEGRRQGFGEQKRWTVLDERGPVGYQRGDFATEAEARAYIANNRIGLDSTNASPREVVTSRVPSAPFVDKTDAWLSLALKRIVKLAVDEGFDRVAFVNGQQSADRYDLSKHVDDVTYDQNSDGTYIVAAHRGSETVWKDMLATEKVIEDHLGKDVAKRIIEGGTDGTLRGLDLKVGGEGMIAFYDKIVPAAVNKLLPKVGGGKLQTVRIDGVPGRISDKANPDYNPLSQPGFDVTDAMREKAADGLPMFAQGMGRPEAIVRPGRVYDELIEQFRMTAHPDGHFRSQLRVPATALSADARAMVGPELNLQLRDDDVLVLRHRNGGDERIHVSLAATGAAATPMFSQDGRRDVTQTPEFKRWFGDSKVVDADGKPLVVYHGTPSDFTSFDARANKDGNRGLYFTPSTDFASAYARDGQVMPVYLSIKNPLVLTDQFGKETPAGRLASRIGKSGSFLSEQDVADLKALGFDGLRAAAQGGAWIALEPTQIKSAIGNRGTFDASNPDILFSQDEGVLGPNDPRNYRALVKQALGDLNDVPGKLHWWHKTVGTQYNLAQRSAPFRRVFDQVQSFLQDVSVYASEAANEAPTLLPKLEKMADIVKTPISAADTKAIAAPIFEGTLAWVRMDGNPVRVDELRERMDTMDPNEMGDILVANKKIAPNVLTMWRGLPFDQYQQNVATAFENRMLRPGIVWTDTELERMFKLDAKQRGHYREFRKATDKSITDLSISDMLRYAGKDAETVRADALAMGDIGAVAALLRAHFMDLIDRFPQRAEQLTKTMNRIQEKAARAQQLIDEGYAPLSRFGHYTVDVVGADGKRLFFSLYESRFEAARAAREFERMAAEKDGEFEGATVTRGTLSKEEYKLFAGVSPETIEMFGEMLGLEATGDDAADKAFQAYLQLAKANRSSMKRLIHRKGVAGFSTDVGRVLAGFVYSNARMTSRNLHAGDIEEAIKEIPKTQGEVKDHAMRLRDYVHNPVEEAQALRGMLFAQYLGGSIASALVNITQPFTMTLPFLSQYGGIGKASAWMRDALKVAWAKTTGNAALDRALQRAVEEGIVAPQEVHHLLAQAHGRGELKAGDGTRLGEAAAMANNALARLTLAWGKPFSTAELFNRRVTFVAAWNSARERGLADPYAFAVDAVEQTQGLYNKGNRPRWARGVVGATAMTFKQFSISYLELIERMWNAGEPGSAERAAGRRAVYFAMGILLLAGGSGGLPFVEDVSDLIDGIMQRLGYAWNTKQKRQEMLTEAFGRGLGHFLDKGVSGLPGVPIDVANRLGLGNLLPATGALKKKTDRSRDMLEVLGPTGDLAQRAIRAGDMAAGGKIIDAGLEVSPIAARNVAKAIEMASTGIYDDTRGYKVLDTTGADALSKAIGFQPSAVARVQEADRTAQEMVALVKLRESEIAGEWAKAIANGKAADGARAAREAIAAWNARNPEAPIKIRLQDVLKRAKNMRMNRSERLEKTAPKEVRATVREMLRQEE